jgi:hypothetical protein
LLEWNSAQLFPNTKTLENARSADKISDDEMKAIMIEAADKCYELLLDLCSPHGADIIDDLKQRDQVPEWDDPKVGIYSRRAPSARRRQPSGAWLPPRCDVHCGT